MGLFGDLGGGIFGGIAGLMSDDGSGDAADYYKRLAGQAGKVNPKIDAQTVNTDRSAEQDVLRNLQGIYRSGGMDPIGKSQIAGAENEANRQATARGNSIQESARANGMGNSAATLALRQQAGQEAGQTANEQAVGAAGLAQQRQLGALSGAAQVGGNISNAQDAIGRFNALSRMGAQQQTFGNTMSRYGMQGNLYGQGYDAQKEGDQRTRAMWSGIGQGVGGIADYFDKPKLPGT